MKRRESLLVVSRKCPECGDFHTFRLFFNWIFPTGFYGPCDTTRTIHRYELDIP